MEIFYITLNGGFICCYQVNQKYASAYASSASVPPSALSSATSPPSSPPSPPSSAPASSPAKLETPYLIFSYRCSS